MKNNELKTLKGITISNIKPRIKMKIWEDCICGSRTTHTFECSKNHRKNRVKQYIHDRIKIRKERQEKHLCASCGKKAAKIRCPHCKRIIGYMYRCKKCEDKIRDYREKRKQER